LSRIDDDHANPRRAWLDMGEPEYLSAAKLEALHAASALLPEPHPLRHSEGSLEFNLVMPPQSVALLKIQLARS
jgi:xylan 1,4-beta-xylosidase